MKIEINSMPLFDKRKRHAELSEYAGMHGFTIDKSMNYRIWKNHLPKFKLFTQKSNKKIRNIISFPLSELEGRIKIFDFLYSDDDMEYKRTTALLFKSELLDLPRFRIKPKGFDAILGKLFMTEYPLFPEYPMFSKQYKVVGKNRAEMRYAIKPEIFPILTHDQKWTLEGTGPYLLWYRKGKTQKRRELTNFCETGIEICHQMINGDSNDYV